MVLLIEHPASRGAERTYIYELLFAEFLGLEYVLRPHARDNLVITAFGEDVPGRIEIPDTFFSADGANWLKFDSLPRQPLRHWDPPRQYFAENRVFNNIPVIYGCRPEESLFEIHDRKIQLGIDLFGSAFFMLTRYEEIVGVSRDQWDRFPATASVAFREGFLLRPIVNEYVEVLWQMLKLLWPRLQRKLRNYRVLLSHDIDVVSVLGLNWPTVVRSLGADLLLRREPRLACRRYNAYLATRRLGVPIAGEPYDTFDFLMETSERFGLRSAFNVVAGTTDASRDPTYDLEKGWMKELLGKFHSRGHEIGFHPSFETYGNLEQTRKEFDRLKRICDVIGIRQENWGGRQHYLRWKNPTTWRNWNDCGLQYDSSLTYAEHVGFRCGCCFEYPVWDLLHGARLALRERPLIAMESSLLTYMGYSAAASADALAKLSNICHFYCGDFTLLWHNHTLASGKLKDLYTTIVQTAVGAGTMPEIESTFGRY